VVGQHGIAGELEGLIREFRIVPLVGFATANPLWRTESLTYIVVRRYGRSNVGQRVAKVA
jgi:hypothetical protein